VKQLALLGPTASGKSAVALAAAQSLAGIELVSVDAMQVYRGMDIGTAKPTAAEQAAVRHHAIDLVDPDHEFTVADFQTSVRAAIADIEGRGGTPLLVGGTGLYLRAVIDDLTRRSRISLRSTPGSSPSIPPPRPRSSRRTTGASCGRSRCASAAADRSARSAPGSTPTHPPASSRSACAGNARFSPSGSSDACRR
jgi:hypothetical protein